MTGINLDRCSCSTATTVDSSFNTSLSTVMDDDSTTCSSSTNSTWQNQPQHRQRMNRPTTTIKPYHRSSSLSSSSAPATTIKPYYRSVSSLSSSSSTSSSTVLSNSLDDVSKSTQNNFLQIDPTKKNKLIQSYGQREVARRTKKEERRSSIFKSLNVLDVDENDADYTSFTTAGGRYNDDNNRQQPSYQKSDGNNRTDAGGPTPTSRGTQGRYLRRGSVTRHKMEADSEGMQPLRRTKLGGGDDDGVGGGGGGDESDYGTDYDSAVSDSEEKSRRRYSRRGSVTKYSLDSSVSTRMQPTDVAPDHVTVKPSRGNHTEYDSAVSDSEEKSCRRYLRRGSVTKYSLDSSIGERMQPTDVAQDQVTIKTLRGNHKSRLPPPPSNDSYTRFDWKFDPNDVDDDIGTDGKKVDNDDQDAKVSSLPSSRMTESSNPNSASIKVGQQQQQEVQNRKPAPRPSRRGSMKMSDKYQQPPTPSMKHANNDTTRSAAQILGDDNYSGNLNDSGHRSRDIYFDPEDVMDLVVNGGKNNDEDEKNNMYDSKSGGMVTSRSATLLGGKAQPQQFHQKKNVFDCDFDDDVIPLFVRKTSSGRSLLVDESDKCRMEDGNFYDADADVDSKLETISGMGGGTTSRTIGLPDQRRHTLQRVGSSSSLDSENSDAEFGSDQHQYQQHHRCSAAISGNAKMPPRLPPTYSTLPSSSSRNVNSLQNEVSFRGNGKYKKNKSQEKETKKKKTKPPPSMEDKASKTGVVDNDSTTSSTRSEEEDGVVLARETNSKVEKKSSPAIHQQLQPSDSSQTMKKLPLTEREVLKTKKQSLASSGVPPSPSSPRRNIKEFIFRTSMTAQQENTCQTPVQDSSLNNEEDGVVLARKADSKVEKKKSSAAVCQQLQPSGSSQTTKKSSLMEQNTLETKKQPMASSGVPPSPSSSRRNIKEFIFRTSMTDQQQNTCQTPVRQSSLTKIRIGGGRLGGPPLGGKAQSNKTISATTNTTMNQRGILKTSTTPATNSNNDNGRMQSGSVDTSSLKQLPVPSTHSTASSRSRTTKRVSFGRVVITEFPIILGDNPAVTSGAPVTIDWTSQGETSYSVDSYELIKPARRRRRKLLISVSSRAILLLAAGYSIDEIADASINAQQIKFSRRDSMLPTQRSWDRVSLLMENTNDALSGMMHNTGKKLKSLIIPKPVQNSESARTA